MPKYNPRKGEGHIRNCVLVIIISMLVSVFLTFVSAVNVVRQTERNARVVLDSYVTEKSVEIYNSIKQGSDRNSGLDAEKYGQSLADFCTFEKNGDFWYNISENQTQFYISEPSLGYIREGSLKIYTAYTVYVPIRFCGIQVGTAAVPLRVTSKLIEKW